MHPARATRNGEPSAASSTPSARLRAPLRPADRPRSSHHAHRTTLIARLSSYDSWIEQRIADIDQQIDDQVDHRDDQRDAHDGGEIERHGAAKRVAAKARPGE